MPLTRCMFSTCRRGRTFRCPGLQRACVALVSQHLPDIPSSFSTHYRAHLQELRPIGQGAFGRVVLALNKIENRLTALKRVRFNSSVLPWAPADVLEAEHERLLREVRPWPCCSLLARVAASRRTLGTSTGVH